jgi:cytochrome c-type biogenesis protein CcmH/NrfG
MDGALGDDLNQAGDDAEALRTRAQAATRLRRYEEAEALLERCLALDPACDAARRDYASLLQRQNKAPQALVQIEMLLARDPRRASDRALRAAILAQLGDYDGAIAIYEALLKADPDAAKTWMSYGHALKTVGRLGDGIAAYRRSLALAPGVGEAYWSLANLKTFRFTAADMAAMQLQLARADLPDEDRYHLDFALGKALEDAGDYAASFEHYRAGNALRRRSLNYDAGRVHEHVARAMALFTPAFFAERAGMGAKARDPIFIVGLPRAGSTLIEQILASHSKVEGTSELPDILAIARRLGGRERGLGEAAYPDTLRNLRAADFEGLGEAFLNRTHVYRRQGRPFFVDKMPNNFFHIGLIHLTLPNARIIDARRGALACSFSCFKQHFSTGQAFAYDLTDLGRYFADYAALMDHFDAVLPGKVHRVVHEEMVADPEREIGRLLDYCGLPFEAACLRFHDTDRAVRTPSSDQVRRPIFTDGLDQWRNYEPWLEPLRAALETHAGAGGALPREGPVVTIG